jgi:hypothetical protein
MIREERRVETRVVGETQEPVRWGRVRGWLLASLASVVLTAALPTDAEAGGYSVGQCHAANGTPAAPDASYSTNASLAFAAATDCHSGNNGMMIGSNAGTFTCPITCTASWSFSAPAGSVITAMQFLRLNQSAGGHSSLVSLCTDSGSCTGWSNDTGGSFDSEQPSGGAWRTFSTFVQCGGTCTTPPGGRTYAINLVFILQDSSNPTITGLGGSLLASGPRYGTEILTIDAADAGAGVRSATVSVNGAEVASRQNPCGGIGTHFRPCGSASFSIPIDTEAGPWVGGANTVQVCARDYHESGQPNNGCATRTVVVDNSCPDSAGPTASVLSAGLQGENDAELRPSVKVRSNKGATIRGQLAGPGGPVGAATVCAYERVQVPGAGRELVQSAHTTSDGGFAIQVPPGPSRIFELVVRQNNRVVEREQLFLDSEVRPTLKAKPKKGLTNGENVRFEGRLPGPNENGRGVSLQAKAGKKWRTFKQLKTNEKGEFKGRYKFTRTSGRITYRFRARVKSQGGYPYSPGSSEKVTVKVRG